MRGLLVNWLDWWVHDHVVYSVIDAELEPIAWHRPRGKR